MKNDKKSLGKLGEFFAANYLQSKGYSIMKTNYTKPFGEIDIIAKKNNELIFCEVKASKYFKNSSFSPEFRIDRKKLLKVSKVAEVYLNQEMFHPKQKWRVDAISVLIGENDKLFKLDHFSDIQVY